MAAMRASLDRSPLPVPHPTRRAHPCRRRQLPASGSAWTWPPTRSSVGLAW